MTQIVENVVRKDNPRSSRRAFLKKGPNANDQQAVLLEMSMPSNTDESDDHQKSIVDDLNSGLSIDGDANSTAPAQAMCGMSTLRASTFPFFFTLMLFFCLFGSAASPLLDGGALCGPETTTPLFRQTCVTKGIVGEEEKSGNICGRIVECPHGQHIQAANATTDCGPPCMCPKGASGCSFHTRNIPTVTSDF